MSDFERDDELRWLEATHNPDEVWDRLVSEANDRMLDDREALQGWTSREWGPE